jgi:4-amino-4-deoxy-L-arabinose transferase-like glycosyltransferase
MDPDTRTMNIRQSATFNRGTGIFIALCALIWLTLAIGRPLNNPDEGRYAEIPREMLATGDWITPRLNGLAYLEKPPLQYWLTALSLGTFGSSEWSARLVALLAAMTNVWLVWLLGRRLQGTNTGWLAACMLGSSALHFVLGQTLTLDMAFTALMTGMLATFCLAQSPDGGRQWMPATWILLGLAVLTKGVVALVIAAGVLGIYLLWQRDRAALRNLRPVSGLLLLFAVTLPWFLAAGRANPDFWHFFFVNQHFERYLTDAADRVEPWWYFGAVLALGCLPWLPAMARTLLLGWRSGAATGRFNAQRLLWLWCVFVILFFSLSQSKLAPYMLPVLPPLALLTALHAPRGRIPGLWFGAVALMLVSLALLVVGLRPAWVSSDAYIAEVALRARWGIIAILLLAVATVAGFFWTKRHDRSVLAVAVVAAGWFGSLTLLFASLGHEEQLRSGRALVPVLASVPAGTPMFSVQTYDQTLPFYLGRTMTLVDYRGELAYGIEHAPQLAIHSLAAFEQRWRELPTAAAVMPTTTYQELANRGLPMRVLGQDRRRVAVSRP